MKHLPIPFAVFASCLWSCTTFKGQYCTPSGFTTACIAFQSKNELLLHTATDLGTSGLSYGRYYQKGDSLIVDFMPLPEKYRVKTQEYYEIESFEPSTGHLALLKIALKGAWTASLAYQPKRQEIALKYLGAILDDTLHITIPSHQFPITLYAEYRNSKLSIPLEKPGHYSLSITLDELGAAMSYDEYGFERLSFLMERKNGRVVGLRRGDGVRLVQSRQGR